MQEEHLAKKVKCFCVQDCITRETVGHVQPPVKIHTSSKLTYSTCLHTAAVFKLHLTKNTQRFDLSGSSPGNVSILLDLQQVYHFLEQKPQCVDLLPSIV